MFFEAQKEKTFAVTSIAVGILSGCASSPHTVRDILAEAGRNEFGGGLCSDTVVVAARSKIDYEQIILGCLARNHKSMHIFFWLSKNAGFDAASSEGHDAVTGVLLRELGDRFFGECLAKEEADIQNRVRDDLLFDLGYGNTDITLEDIKKQFPKTFPRRWTDNN